MTKASSVLMLRQPHNDGVGAQLLRIFSTYAISANWNMDFTYENLGSVDNQVFENVSEVDKWNSFLQRILPRKIFETDEFRWVLSHENHRPQILLSQIRFLELLGTRNLHIINSPQVIVNRFPKYLTNLQNLEGVSEYRMPRNSKKLKISVHIRQGEIYFSQFKSRYLPLSYFESIVQSIIETLRSEKIEYEIRVFFEPNQEKLLDPNHPSVKLSLSIDPSNPHLQKMREGYFQIIPEYPSKTQTPYLYNSSLVTNQSAFQTFLDFLNSDILVISKSSFSYLAGLLTRELLVVHPQFSHPPLPSWLSTQELKTFRKQLELWITKFK